MSNQAVRDPLLRQRYRFSREGDVLRIDIWSEPGGGVLTEHFHPTIEERYEVLEGQLTVHVEGKRRVLGPGERAVVPPVVRHRFENTGERESHVLVEAEPAEQLRESIEEAAALGSREHFSPDDKPRSARALFAAVSLAHRYREIVVPSSPPRPVQRILFPILTRFDRSPGSSRGGRCHPHALPRPALNAALPSFARRGDGRGGHCALSRSRMRCRPRLTCLKVPR